MCGITGIQHRDPLQSPDPAYTFSLLASIQHRGPDHTGYFKDGSTFLGHTRLSIVDVSEKGTQPIFNESGSTVVVFNGEIYNHIDLRNRLIAKGYKFKSKSDGEILAHLYDEAGIQLLRLLEGMFAFALYDKNTATLYLARDRTGEKPLFYKETQSHTSFSSEISSLIEPGERLNSGAFVDYLNYTQSPAPHTFFRNIKKLKPSHYAIIKNGSVQGEHPYWNLSYLEKSDLSFTKASEELESLLVEVVNAQFAEEVDCAILLSGGVDSSLVLSCLEPRKVARLKAYTLGSIQPGIDDIEFARASNIARHFGKEVERFEISEIPFDVFLRHIGQHNEPVGLWDSIHLSMLCEHIRRDGRVVALSGNGADEVFAGYGSYVDYLRSIPSHARASQPALQTQYLAWLKKQAESVLPYFKMEWLSESQSCLDSPHPMTCIGRYDNLMDAHLFYELFVTLNHAASLSDIVGMPFALELRSPFLHHKVIEFAAKLPTHYKLHTADAQTSTKFILKDIAERRLPPGFSKLAKIGCGAKIDYWWHIQGPWRNDILNLLDLVAPLLQDGFNTAAIYDLFRAAVAGQLPVAQHSIFVKMLILFGWMKEKFQHHPPVSYPLAA